MKKLFVAIATFGLPAIASAHPGHGTSGDGFGFVHVLTEPEHLVPLAAIALAIGTAVQWFRRKPVKVTVRRDHRS